MALTHDTPARSAMVMPPSPHHQFLIDLRIARVHIESAIDAVKSGDAMAGDHSVKVLAHLFDVYEHLEKTIDYCNRRSV